MKKLLVLLLILLLSGTALAETISENPLKHDVAVFEKMDGYAYDKFDRDWDCHGAFVKNYTDAKLVLGIQINGNDAGPTFLPHLYAWLRKPDNTTALYDITSIDILIGDTLYSYPKWQVEDTYSYVFLAENNGKELVKAMAEASEISFRLNFATGNTSLDISPEEYSTTLRPIARALVDFDIWSYIDDPNTLEWEKAYPLVIE